MISGEAPMLMTPDRMTALLARTLPKDDWHGQTIERVEEGTVRLGLALSSAQLSHDLPPGSGQAVVSGPLMMGVAETAMYAAVFSAFGDDVFPVVLNFNIAFLRLAGTDRLIVDAAILRKAKQVCFVEAKLYSDIGGDVVAQASATYSVRPNPR